MAYIQNNGKKSTLYWFVQTLKYGVALVVAILSFYAARQDKGQEALDQIKTSYEEQSRQVVQLQDAVKALNDGKQQVIDKCKTEVDTIRSNMTFFLMGVAKSNRQKIQIKESRQILSELVKGVAKSKSKLLPKAKALPLKRPKNFNDLMSQSAK